MAQTEMINEKKWKIYFRDRKRTCTLWPTDRYVARNCKISDGTKRHLKIELEPKYNISTKGQFTITSGEEIYFPKIFQDRIAGAFEDKKSFLTVEVLD